ncbi:septum formation family protein [Oerskovia enterophila]
MSTPPPPPGYDPDVYYAPGWQPAAARTEPLALAAIPTGLLLGPVGVGVGAAALARIRRNRTRGVGLAWAGIALGLATTLTAIAVGVALLLGGAATRALPADVSAPQDAHARQLVLGNCLADLPDDGPVSTLRVVPCAEPHEAQVVARTDFSADSLWPGQGDVESRVSRVCVPAVLADDVDPAGIELSIWTPSEESWAEGDRTGLCLAATPVLTEGSLID